MSGYFVEEIDCDDLVSGMIMKYHYYGNQYIQKGGNVSVDTIFLISKACIYDHSCI